ISSATVDAPTRRRDSPCVGRTRAAPPVTRAVACTVDRPTLRETCFRCSVGSASAAADLVVEACTACTGVTSRCRLYLPSLGSVRVIEPFWTCTKSNRKQIDRSPAFCGLEREARPRVFLRRHDGGDHRAALEDPRPARPGADVVILFQGKVGGYSN